MHRIAVSEGDIPGGIKKYKLSVAQKDDEDVRLSLTDIKWLQEQFVKIPDGSRPNSFHDLMIGCDVKLPEPEVQPRNQELEARIQRLKAEQADREYKAMTKNVDTTRVQEPEETISYQSK